jgi:8-oxo-dGTP pyrophosphatase MutT (NUDIX family)
VTYRERQRLADIQAAIDAIRSHLQRGDPSDGLVFDAVRIRLGWWLYPGGHIESDEDPAQAVIREVTEETGITCQITAESRFIHPAATVLPAPFTICVQDIPADMTTGPHQHIDMVYVLAADRGQVIPQREEVTGCAWIPLAKVADLDTPPELPALIEKAAEYARAVRG